MVLTIIYLLQSHPPAKISWLLWAVAILFFLLGLTLLIYLMTRPKEAEADEVEEGTSRGLLATADQNAEKNSAETQEESASPAAAEKEAEVTMPLFSEDDFKRKKAPKNPSLEESQAHSPAVVAPEVAAPVLPMEVAEDATASPDQATVAGERQAFSADPAPSQIEPTPVKPATPDEAGSTRILTSQKAEPAAMEDTTVSVARENLDESPILSATPQKDDQLSGQPEEDIYSPQEEALFSQSGRGPGTEFPASEFPASEFPASEFPASEFPASDDKATREFVSFAKEQVSARVEAPVSQPRFESTAKSRREPFEPPTIEPIAPRPVATQELSSQSRRPAADKKEEAKTTVLSSQPPVTAPAERRFEEGEAARPVDASQWSPSPTSFKPSPETAPQAAPLWETQSSSLRSGERKPAGSVLGIPAETSHAPLTLGQPAARGEVGVAALTNYGKDLDAADTGRGGAIALVIVALLVGGALLAYFLIPSVHSYTNNLVAQMRGKQSAPPVVEKPKAQIYPSRATEINKNLVKVRGAVTNISEEVLEGLEVEISLDRGEGTNAETRTVMVTPNALAPSQRGIYELEYEGSKATGFSRYKVTRLLSKSGEIKFSMPNQ